MKHDLRINAVTINTGKNIEIDVSVRQGDTDFVDDDTRKFPNRPMDEFSQAFTALGDVFCEVFQVPKDKWGQHIVVKGLTVVERDDEERTAVIHVEKTFPKIGKGASQKNKTPAFIFEGENLDCKQASADLIIEALAQAEKYYNGERQAISMAGAEPTKKGEEDENQDQLPGT